MTLGTRILGQVYRLARGSRIISV